MAKLLSFISGPRCCIIGGQITLWPVLCQDLGQIFGLLCKLTCGGLIRWTLWHCVSPGKEHHARLVQGLSNWQV